MSTLVILEAQIKPGFYDQAAQIMVEQLPDTRAFPGCQGIYCYRERAGQNVNDFVSEGVGAESAVAAASKDNGERLVLVEYWDSIEAYHKYVTWRTQSGDLPNFADICDGPPHLRTFDLMPG